jgi:hypothetical protein
MKRIALLILILVFFHISGYAQGSGASSQTSHFISLTLSNMLYFSLEANGNSDVSAKRQLIVNSNIPMNISVKEITTESFVTYIPEIPEESHGPSITQIRSALKVNYYSDRVPYFTTKFLYTAAPI